ncbi:efflux RND transporter periplasmic adaptor subunit [Ferrimonas lipolytica]|uniref:Efflux RND transporter periplasmic adaptor subunit n=1 Tax=Ferrimonas lipolytica TaxID=2724191 RepID=A0A6H1UD77_9GAMM|nr:efflux RND transporter periplasmic adaptor subunit [Ferrimonas lipolytica]QIZ77057.1 efflux RND transporter periplasmic adaptor subunit [Ferrimonas lipolytica]
MKTNSLSLWLTLLLITCSSATAAPTQPARVIQVQSEAVAQHILTPELTVVGNLEAERAVTIAPQISGKIAKFAVTSNQQVAAGEALIHIADAEARASELEAQAYLTDELRKLAELQRLIKKGAVTQSEIDAQQASVAMAQARLQAATAQLDYHHITAPFAGTVGLVNYSAGALVDSGTDLLSLDDLSSLRLDLAVPERFLSQLRTGVNVSATSQAWPEQSFSGEVIAIAPRVAESSLNLKVRVRFSNEMQQLKPGMMLAATIKFGEQAQPVVPIQALEYSGTKRFVYVIEGDKAHRTEVVLGQRVGTKVAIKSGINIGQRIVVEGLVNLSDGVLVNDLAQTNTETNGAINAAL